MKSNLKALINKIDRYGTGGLLPETIDEILEIVEKQIPRKPVDWDDTEKYFIKCTCGKIMDTRVFEKYCTKCGQHLEY